MTNDVVLSRGALHFVVKSMNWILDIVATIVDKDKYNFVVAILLYCKTILWYYFFTG